MILFYHNFKFDVNILALGARIFDFVALKTANAKWHERCIISLEIK